MNIQKSFLHGVLTIAILVAIVSGCSNSTPQIYLISGPIMGTTYHIKFILPSHLSDDSLKGIEDQVVAAMTRVDSLMSTYKDSSEISQLNRYPVDKWFVVSEDSLDLIKQAVQLSKASKGKYDITVGPLVNLWGFGPDARPVHTPDQEAIDTAKARVGYQYLEIDTNGKRIKKHRDLYIDLSSIAKGFGVDQAAEALADQGISNYLVEIGGEIRASGHKGEGSPWVLAIEAPNTMERSVFKKISVSDRAVATSGDYRNYYEENGVRYSHTIDPDTGRPIGHKLASATVIVKSCAQADALATMFMVMGEELAYEYAVKEKLPVYLIYHAGDQFKVRYTPEFKHFLIE